MQNNQVKSLNVAVQDRPKSYKDKSGSLHITMDFGSVVCGRCLPVIPDTDFSVGDRERVILTSLVAPCFGRISLKSYSYFVAMSDIFRNIGSLDSDVAIWRGSNASAQVFGKLPFINQRELSLMCLFGAQMTIYSYDEVNEKVSLQVLPANIATTAAKSSLPSGMQQALNDLGIDFAGSSYGFSNAARLDIVKLIDPSYTSSLPIYLSNLYYSTFFDARTNHPDDTIPSMDPIDLQNGYDCVVPVSVEYTAGSFRHYYLAFKFSSFGRRLYKNLVGCGWQLNIASQKEFSILPFLAYYKAYFDLFGVERFKAWEQTIAYRIIQYCDVSTGTGIQFRTMKSTSSIFRDFLLEEFGCTYFTSEMDFVAAHTRDNAISPSAQGIINSIVTDVDSGHLNVPNIQVGSSGENEPSGLTTPSNHARITNTIHGQLDSNLLKRLYRSTNVNTAAGRRISELMRAQGLGDYMDHHPSRFIGSWDLELPIYDLPSQSDTYNKVTHEGMQLGEYGAYGNQNGVHEKVHYKSFEDGWFINLIVVVPKGGYAQVIDPDITCLTKSSRYNPIYDSLGYEYTSKDETVLGSIAWQQTGIEAPDSSSGSLTDSFGLVPRDFKRKFGRNIINGEFAFHSKFNTYSQWNLERLITVNDKRVEGEVTTALGTREWHITHLNKPSLIPIAGDVWRYLCRYEWLNRFNRIFYNSYSTFSGMSNISDSVRTVMFEYFSLRDDNFVLHMIHDIDVYDKMLPVQDSFETEDDEAKANSKMSKA